MSYKFIIAAITVLAFTACSEGRKTPDGYEMDNPPPSAYAPSDYETFDQKKYEPASVDQDATDEVVEENIAGEVDDVVGEAEDDEVKETEEADDTVDEEEE